MSEFNVKIEDGIEIPKREVNFGPRGSKYPLLTMKEGQSFALQIVGKDGVKNKAGEVLTAAQDAERKARQKQSYFSGFGKRNGIAVVTRYKPETGELRVWHGGKAEEAAPDTKTDGAEQDAGSTPSAVSGSEQNAAATGAAGSDDMDLD